MENNKKYFLKEITALVIQIILSRFCIDNLVCPFGLPYAFVRVYYGGNIFLIIFSYIISKLNFILSFSDLFICFFEIVILSLYFYIKNYVKKKNLLVLELSMLISSSLQLYYVLFFRLNITMFFVDLLLKLIFCIIFYYVFKAYKNKFIFFKFSNLDYFYFSIFLFVLSLSLFSFSLNLLYLDYFILTFILIFSYKILPSDKFFLVALSVGLGATFANGIIEYLLFVTINLLVLMIIKNKNKYLFMLEIFCIIISFYFIREVEIISLLSSFFAAIIFICFKSSFIDKLKHLFDIDSIQIMRDNLKIGKFIEIKNKLNLMASTFKNMQKDFKFLMIGKINRSKAYSELADDVISQCCKKCENFNSCFFENINKRSMFESLVARAIEKGKINKDDFFNGLQNYCFKESIIISEVNQIAEMFLSYEQKVKEEDLSKLIISDELENFSDIFQNFSKLVNFDIRYNFNHSRKLKEFLINNLISVNDVLIVENNYGIQEINIVVQNEDVLKKDIIDAIFKYVRINFKLKSVRHLEFSGLSFAVFVPCERLQINVVVSSKSKENQNGDNVAVKKLSNSKYFVAIADGMGHGESANRISNIVLSLVQSMFEIGFDDDLIIKSINRLIIPIGLNNFSTLDACIFDLDKQVCTFVKLGATVSVLKHKQTSEIISCSSLPVGVVGSVEPTIIRKQIDVGDVIFLASDGIVDSFSSIENYKTYINDSKISNLQRFIDDVIFDASFQNQKHIDDMTIIAINMLKKY